MGIPWYWATLVSSLTFVVLTMFISLLVAANFHLGDSVTSRDMIIIIGAASTAFVLSCLQSYFLAKDNRVISVFITAAWSVTVSVIFLQGYA